MILLILSCSRPKMDSAIDIDDCSVVLREEFVLQEGDCMEGKCFVPEGDFIMGEGNPEQPDQCPARKIFLSEFWIDEKEVTVAAYRNCVDVGSCSSAEYCPSYAVYEEAENLPQTCVTWFQAQEYCSYVGGALPTEAQWEKSARGSTGASWPWGDLPPSCGVANFRYSPAYCYGGPIDVGSFADVDPLVSNIPITRTPYGLLDTVGNVWEWTADWYDARYFRYGSHQDPEGPTQCSIDVDTEAADCIDKVIKGGAYNTVQDVTKGSARAFIRPEWFDDNIGFRCMYE